MSLIQGHRICKCFSSINQIGRALFQSRPVFSRVPAGLFHSTKSLTHNVNPYFKAFNRHDERQTDIQDDEKFYKQEMMIEEAIRDHKLNTIDDIENLKSTVVNSRGSIKDSNFDPNFLSICCKEKAYDVGKIFIDHIYRTNPDLSLAVAGRFFKLCHACKDRCSEDDLNLIYQIYTRLLERYEILDSSSCESATLALSITSMWREISKLFELCRLSSEPTSRMYSAYAIAAIKNGEPDLAWEIINEAVENNRKPHLEVFEELLQNSTMDKLEEIYMWFEKHQQHLQIELAYKIMDKHTELTGDRTKSTLTSITPEGKCRKCQKHLNPVSVTDQEFDVLKKAFLDPVLIGKDIFLKTKPRELESFFNFLNQYGKVDVVLDGLNIAYATNRVGSEAYAYMLRSVLENFVGRNKRVVVLGRKHMLRWPASEMNYIKKNSGLFLTENVSADDPFLLYATMHSGLGTKFVSRDQMRGHKFLLKEPKLQKIFSKWQQQHQEYVKYVGNDGRVFFHRPPPYLLEVHSTDDTWHLPIAEDTPGGSPIQQVYNTTWLCVTRA